MKSPKFLPHHQGQIHRPRQGQGEKLAEEGVFPAVRGVAVTAGGVEIDRAAEGPQGEQARGAAGSGGDDLEGGFAPPFLQERGTGGEVGSSVSSEPYHFAAVGRLLLRQDQAQRTG